MNETLFSASSLLALLAWLGLSLATLLPANTIRDRLLLVTGRIVPIILCLLYSILLVINLSDPSGGGFDSLSSVVKLFASPDNVLSGWVHFLAFDLLVGRWIIDDTLAERRYRWPLLLVLPATFLFGPFGLLLYAIACLSLPRKNSTETRETAVG